MTSKDEMPEQVRQFVEAASANAREAWGDDDPIAEDIMYAHKEARDGDRWVISDNYERFFSTIFIFDDKTGAWTTRVMYSDAEEKPYTFEKVMADASILFTG